MVEVKVERREWVVGWWGVRECAGQCWVAFRPTASWSTEGEQHCAPAVAQRTVFSASLPASNGGGLFSSTGEMSCNN